MNKSKLAELNGWLVWLVIAVFITLFLVSISYAAYIITLTDMRVENFQIYRQSVVINPTTGETEVQMKMSMNYTLYNGGDAKGLAVEFALSPAQRTQVLNFVKPFVQAQAVVDDVTAPVWAQ